MQRAAIILLICWAGIAPRADVVVHLSDLDLAKMTCGRERPRRDKTIDGNVLTIGGQKFARGVGTHAGSDFFLEVQGKAKRFNASVGIDDEVGAVPASVTFRVVGDGKELFGSGVMYAGRKPLPIDVDLTGVKQIILTVSGGKDGTHYDHADWAEARFTLEEGKLVPYDAPGEEAVILTPPPPPTPRINGARVFGVRPGHPILFTVPATGERPITFSAQGLPAGARLDPGTGRIGGKVDTPGEYKVTLTAKNVHGRTRREWRLVVGDRICLTPPMGWNSWNCFAGAVTADHIRSAADAMAESGLIDHGWSYINIDDYWEVKPGSEDPTLQGPPRAEDGTILCNPRFPDMKGLVDHIHGLGLKAGLYTSPGPLTCGDCIGSYRHEEQDAAQYAKWGFDYLKYDWCSYGKIAKGHTLYELMKPYFIMRDALLKQDRDIVYSLCQYGMGHVSAWGAKVGGNCWRTTGDIEDTWSSMSNIGFRQNGLEHFAEPGHWNDPDMLVVGHVGWGSKLHPTRLSPNEQYTHISLWCLLAAPLLIGCDMTQLDEFTLALLTNDEVLEVNQDPLGKQAYRVSRQDGAEVWMKTMEDGSKAIGLFNRDEFPRSVTATWSRLGLAPRQHVRDLWRQKDQGVFTGQYATEIPRHGVVLVKVRPVRGRD